jgi:hypothetical protein
MPRPAATPSVCDIAPEELAELEQWWADAVAKVAARRRESWQVPVDLPAEPVSVSS